MSKQYSTIDIGHHKPKPKHSRAKYAVKRQVLGRDFNFLAKPGQTPAAPEIIVERKEKKRERFPLRAGLLRTASVAGVGLMIILLMQGLLFVSSAQQAKSQILGDANSAYSQLSSAGKNLTSQNFDQAQTLFQSAQSNIGKAQGELENFKILELIAPQAATADHVLTGAGFLADAGSEMTTALSLFDQLKVGSKDGDENLGPEISKNRDQLTDVQALITKASDEFNAAGALPVDYQNTFTQAKTQISELNSIIGTMLEMENLYLALFSGQKTYFLAFENNNELRATGGFIGTYGVLHTNNGGIQDLKIQSIYQLDGQITDQIAAPGPFQPDIPKWGIRDSNWFINFPTSAQKILNFFENGQETGDGVIAFTPAMFEDLLKITGPIDMPDYGITLTADNFQDMVQFETSFNYDKTLNQPKKFLDDFAPALLSKLSLFTKDQWFTAFTSIEDNLSSRQVVMYSTDSNTQKMITDDGFAGQVLDTDHDYLMINNTNLGGTKTDLGMQQNAILSSKILGDGSVIDTLEITRTNTNPIDENKDYLRVLVPLHSTFISATGFDNYDYYTSQAPGLSTDADLNAWDQGSLQSNVLVHTEADKSEFSGWLDVAGGQTKSITLTYILPFKLSFNSFGDVEPYTIMVQKQIGSIPYQLTGTLDLGGLNETWSTADMKNSGGTLNFSSNTNVDDFWAMLLTK